MKSLNKILENRKIDYDKLITYGFIKEKDNYYFEKIMSDVNFKVIINISSNIQSSKVIDLLINEEYLLVDYPDAKGEFVGKIREEYENLINDIINKCTTPNIFKGDITIKIIKYIEEKYHDDLEYLWEKFPNCAIWRNKTNNKWYGLLVTLKENKLGIDSDNTIEIIDLRYQKDKINNIIDNRKIFPGYHMNKNSWITIKLDGSVDIEEIYNLIDNSYNISIGNK